MVLKMREFTEEMRGLEREFATNRFAEMRMTYVRSLELKRVRLMEAMGITRRIRGVAPVVE